MPDIKQIPSKVYIEDLATATTSWNDCRMDCSECGSAPATRAMMVCDPDPQPVVDLLLQWVDKMRRTEVMSAQTAQVQTAIFQAPMSLFEWEKTVFLCNACHSVLVQSLNRLDSYSY